MLRFGRSLLLASVVLCAALTASAVSVSAGAGGPIGYVDPAGTCAGLSVQCYTTIQQAVRLAGPAPAEVNVFPGSYNEAVKLDEMGADLGSGGGPGDITLRTLDIGAHPAPGTAKVIANQGQGASISALNQFTGSVTVIGFVLTPKSGDGITLNISGNATLTDVDASGSKVNGVRIIRADNVLLTRVTTNNTGAVGVMVSANHDLTVIDSTANDNRKIVNVDGFNLSAGGNITTKNVTANGNKDDGIDVDEATGAVTMKGCAFAHNGGDGLDVDGTQGTVEIDNCSSLNNGDDGYDIRNDIGDARMMTQATLKNSEGKGNADDGVQFGIDGPSTIVCVNLDSNVASGVHVSERSGALVTAEGNYWGDPTGPAHATNPGGAGEVIDDSGGTIDFMPFLTQPCVPSFDIMWVDVDCSGAIDGLDALAIATLLSGASAARTTANDCPPLDVVLQVEGLSPQKLADVNCDAAIDGMDIVFALRVVAGLETPAPPSGCPAPGQHIVATPQR